MTLLNEAWFDCCTFMKIIPDAIGRVFVSYDIYVMFSIITILNIGIIPLQNWLPVHILGQNILLTLLKLFSLVFYV